MIAVSLPADDLVPYLEDSCDLAASNAPGLSVASGGVAEIDALEKRLEEAEIDFQRVSIERAAHSRLLDPILDEFRSFVEKLDLKAPSIPFISNRTGERISDKDATSPEYWVQHLRNEVRFSEGLRTILATPGQILLEVGPGQALCPPAAPPPFKPSAGAGLSTQAGPRPSRAYRELPGKRTSNGSVAARRHSRTRA